MLWKCCAYYPVCTDWLTGPQQWQPLTWPQHFTVQMLGKQADWVHSRGISGPQQFPLKCSAWKMLWLCLWRFVPVYSILEVPMRREIKDLWKVNKTRLSCFDVKTNCFILIWKLSKLGYTGWFNWTDIIFDLITPDRRHPMKWDRCPF